MAQAALAIGGSVLSGVLGGKGAEKAAKEQAKAIQRGINAQQTQYAATQYEFAPYLGAGTSALNAQLDLLGLGGSSRGAAGADTSAQADYLAGITGPKSSKQLRKALARAGDLSPEDKLALVKQYASPKELAMLNAFVAANPYKPAGTGDPGTAQQASISALKESPLFTSLYGVGNDTILQNAAATGGLRGGNTENSLAQFSSSLLAQVIQNQLSNLGGISGQGAELVSNLGQLGQQSANAQQQGYGQLGNANAAATAAPYAALQGIISQLTGGGQASLGNFFGGGSSLGKQGIQGLTAAGAL